MKKKILAVVVTLMMALPLLFISAGPAQAACVANVNTKYDYKQVLDDELNGYIRVFVSVYFNDCGSSRTFKYIRGGYGPDTNHNSTLRCGSSLGKIDQVRINVGAIMGYNPGEVTLDCYAGGTYRTFDYSDIGIPESDTTSDRCAGASWTAVLPYWNDVSGSVPLTCF